MLFRFVRRYFMLCLPIFLLLPQNLVRAESIISPSLELRETFISNKTATLDESGNITSISPGIGYQATGSNTDINVNYSLNALYYSGLAQENEVNQALNLRSGFNHIQGRWNSYLTGSIRQANVSRDGVQVLNPDIQSDNNKELRTFGLGTAFNGRLGNSVIYNSNLDADYADFEDSEDTNGYGVLLGLRSRQNQNKLNWNISVATRVENTTGDDQQIDTVIAGLDYRFNRRYSGFLTSTKSETDRDDDLLNNTSTLVGINWTPSRNSSIRAGVGERGEDTTYTLDSRFIRDSSTFTASYDETVTTNRSLLVEQTVDPQLIEPTGQTLSIAPVLVKTGRVAVTTTGRRSDVTLALFEQSTERETLAVDEEVTTGVSLGFNRTLSATSTVQFNISHQEIDTTQNNKTDDAIVSYTRQLSKKANFSVEVRKTKQSSDVVENEYEQESLSIRLFSSF